MAKEKVEAKPHYEEWRVDLKKIKSDDGKKIVRVDVEKLKCVRKRVLISDYQAEVLNEGTLNGFSTAPIMYFKPETHA